MNAKPPGQDAARQRPPNAIEQALQRADFALAHQRPAEAERIAAEILKINRDEPRALQMLGCALLLQGRFKDSIVPLEKAARRSHDPAVEMQLAIALKQIGQIEEALERLRRAIKRRPLFPPAFLELGRQLAAAGRHDEAIDVLERCLALAPDAAHAAVQLGFIYAMRNNGARARAVFTQALSHAPDHVQALYGLARATQRDGDYAAAAKLYRRVLAIKADAAAARIGYGACLLELGASESALESFRLAARGAPHIYGQVLAALAESGRGRFWLKPSAAARAIKGEKI